MLFTGARLGCCLWLWERGRGGCTCEELGRDFLRPKMLCVCCSTSCARLGLPNSETRVFRTSPPSTGAPSGIEVPSAWKVANLGSL
jgi:hypothetical protein